MQPQSEASRDPWGPSVYGIIVTSSSRRCFPRRLRRGPRLDRGSRRLGHETQFASLEVRFGHYAVRGGGSRVCDATFGS
eukprot:9274349-Pyramimonas_sp.AAC.1